MHTVQDTNLKRTAPSMSGRGLALMLAPTAAFAATLCCDGGDCCNDVAMPCCE